MNDNLDVNVVPSDCVALGHLIATKNGEMVYIGPIDEVKFHALEGCKIALHIDDYMDLRDWIRKKYAPRRLING